MEIKFRDISRLFVKWFRKFTYINLEIKITSDDWTFVSFECAVPEMK